MRLTAPRIPPLPDEAADPEQAAFLDRYRGPRGVLNIYRTMARNIFAARAFHTWGGHVRLKSDLHPRQREMLILRTGWLCASGYEWAQHSRLGREAGLSNEELERLKQGPAAEGWTAEERTLLQAADELHADFFISDRTWAALGRFLNDAQRMDVVFVCGHYTQVCMVLNTFGVQLETGVKVDADLVRHGAAGGR